MSLVSIEKVNILNITRRCFPLKFPLSEVFLDPGTRMGIGFQRILLLNSTRAKKINQLLFEVMNADLSLLYGCCCAADVCCHVAMDGYT